MKHYQVQCKKCKSARQVGIVEGSGHDLIDWLDNNPNPQVTKIISGRKRLDGNWGWQCVCGNNDLLTQQEVKEIKNKTDPDPVDISRVIKGLIPQKPQFEMRAV